ncbi:uncharacterized protein LOC134245948 [Saccostrea cucullata]|uniref:uncharacterized protein LOC134245948 n=1 Tax=Saccostrea cuccullata TaxID=36930 RepID=UPI002ED5802A
MAAFRCRYKLKSKIAALGSFLFVVITVHYFISSKFRTKSQTNSIGRKSYSRVYMSSDVQNLIQQNDICGIHQLPLYSREIEHAIQPMEKPLVCNGTNLFYFKDNILSMNTSVLYPNHNTIDLYEFKSKKLENKPVIKACELRGIERVTDSFFTYTESIIKEKEPFNFLLKHDFVRVKCLLNSTVNLINADENETEKIVSNDGSYNEADERSETERNIFEEYLVDFDQFLVQVYPQEEVFKRASALSDSHGSDRMNVMMIVLDSMSHMSFRRKLPKTYSFLKKNLASTILNAYNIVGDATLAALIPILTGKTELELPEVRKSQEDAYYVDIYPMIWKEFKKKGYVTMFAEDEPSISAFNLRLNGFKESPVDHYMRPFWQAIWDSELRERSKRYCTGGTPHHQFLLEYLKDFYVKYQNVSKFSLTFLAELTHWDNNPGEYLDVDFVNSLKVFSKLGFLDNTLLIVMGDHGARYGRIRRTLQGKMEERLPFMSLHFPHRFKLKHPHLIKLLSKNANRLTTPFDVYETLRDVLDSSRLYKPVTPSRGISLLQEIPANRNCVSAHIDLHWCSCLVQSKVDPNSDNIKVIADQLLRHINDLTLPLRDSCHELSIHKIKSANLMSPNEKVLKFMKTVDADQRVANFSSEINVDVAHYQITMETIPNYAQYEGTVTKNLKDNKYEVFHSISRLDHYGNQSACVMKQYPDLRKFCHCR